MKTRTFSKICRSMLLLSLLLAGSRLNADTLNKVIDQPLEWGSVGTISGTSTYALSSAITGTASSVIDLATTPGIYVHLTGTVGTVQVEFSGSATVARNIPFNLAVGRDYFLPRAARYLRFINSSAANTSGVVTVWYEPALDNFTVKSGAEAMYLPVSNNNHYSSLSTSATVVNLSTTAASTINKPFEWALSSQSGDFYWDWGSSATAPSRLSHLQSVSTTAISQDKRAPGTVLYFKGATTTAEVGLTIGQQQ